MEHWAFYLRARILEAFGHRESAISAYAAALRVNPDFHRSLNRIAYLLASMERYAEAEPRFGAVLARDPGNAVAHFNLGFAREKLGRYEEAIASFAEATRLNPKIDRAWYGMGMCHAHLGQHGQAAAAFEEAAMLQPMNPHAWYALGMAQHACHNPERVKAVVLHLVRFDPRMARRLIVETESTDLAYLVKDLVV
jgi:tetratricopeptide (TPR) repeat protein